MRPITFDSRPTRYMAKLRRGLRLYAKHGLIEEEPCRPGLSFERRCFVSSDSVVLARGSRASPMDQHDLALAPKLECILRRLIWLRAPKVTRPISSRVAG